MEASPRAMAPPVVSPKIILDGGIVDGYMHFFTSADAYRLAREVEIEFDRLVI
jgi:hypothetical protein